MVNTIIILLNIAAVYLVIGMFFSVLFLWKGINKVDTGAIGTGIVFKLLIFPGLVCFWPMFLKKWINNR